MSSSSSVCVQTFASDTPADKLVTALNEQGACIIADLLSPSDLARTNDELEPLIAPTPYGEDFTGHQTQRTGALVARSAACREHVMHPLMLEGAQKFLEPYTKRILLHLTQTIRIHPGQGKQPLHRDRLAWGGYLPRSIEPQFNTIWALSDFTADNGATRLVPGSNHWDDEQRAEPEQMCQAEMSAGSVLLYSGSVIHSGGENRTQDIRTGLNITYCLGWLRQEENQYLSCPPEVAKDLAPELQELLGYTQGEYALGYYSDPYAEPGTAETIPPEHVLGRRSRKDKKLFAFDGPEPAQL